MKSVRYRPIGVIRSPFKNLVGMPIQPAGAGQARGRIQIAAKYRAGLKDLDGFSHVLLLYHFNRSHGFDLEVVPFLDHRRRGVFATRAPRRPNAIGLSVVRLISIRGRILTVSGVDIVDGTPLLDIKPYVPEFDHIRSARFGWLEKARRRTQVQKTDQRFKTTEPGSANGALWR